MSARETNDESGRQTWTEEQIMLVRSRYPYCQSRVDKESLARRAGIDSVASLYNLANRLKVTRPHQSGAGTDHRLGEERLLLREHANVPFDHDQDGFLLRNFGTLPLDQIAFHIDHTETPTLVRARHLGVRRFCKYWEAHRVCAWLDRSASQLTLEGVAFHVLQDQGGSPAIVVASSSSLIRAVGLNGEIMRAAGADIHFLREITEMGQAVAAGIDGGVWESSRWVSHEHVCLNPWAGVSFGLFDDGGDLHTLCRDLHPEDISIPVSHEDLDTFVADLRLP